METETLLGDEAVEQVEALRMIFQTLPLGVLVANRDRQLWFVNTAAERILGSRDARQGGPAEWTTIYGCYLPDQATLLSPEELPLVRALRGEEVVDEIIFVRNAERPARVWFRASGRPLREPGGKVTSAAMVFCDAQQGRELPHHLLLSQVVEQIADGVLFTDNQGLIEYVNPAFEAIIGYSQDDVRGKTPRILEAGLHDDVFHQQLWSRLLDGHSSEATIVNRKKSGELYHARQTITPITDGAGTLTHFVSVMQDVTEILKKQEQEVQLRLARQVQQKFYRAAPTVSGFDVAAGAYPAYQTSGDYFDFISLPHGRLLIAVGDVEGHGFGSAGDGPHPRVCALVCCYGPGGRPDTDPGQSNAGQRSRRRLFCDPHAGMPGRSQPVPRVRRSGTSSRLCAERIR